jgi:membrane associated rhomboid family serine protease
LKYKKAALTTIAVGVIVIFLGIALASIGTADYYPYAFIGLILILCGWLVALIGALFWYFERKRHSFNRSPIMPRK